MSTLINLIEQHLGNPNLTNAALANMCGISERQFYRQVIDGTGKSPNKLIREVRLQKASELLDSGKYNTVKEVAIRVGFLKVSYFSKLYQKWTGKRPSELLS